LIDADNTPPPAAGRLLAEYGTAHARRVPMQQFAYTVRKNATL
jgi:hypothetical protein